MTALAFGWRTDDCIREGFPTPGDGDEVSLDTEHLNALVRGLLWYLLGK